MNASTIISAIQKRYAASNSLRDSLDLVVLLSVLGGLIFFVAIPLTHNIFKYTTTVADVRNIDENLIARAQRVQQANTTIQKLSTTDIQKIRNAIPTNPSALAYIATIERLAQEHGVLIRSVEAKNISLDEKTISYTDLISFTLTGRISGSFESIQNFLLSLRNTTRSGKLTQLTIATPLNSPTLEASVDMNIYYVR